MPDVIPNQPPPGNFANDFFVYEVDTLGPLPAGLAPAASQPLSIVIQADSYFKLIKLAHFTDIAAAAQTESTRVVPLVNIQITDTGSGRQLFSAPTSMGALFGDGRLPFILPIVRVFQPSATVSIVLTNYSAATTYNVRLALIGIKSFMLGRQVRPGQG
jgi:hypothetical protein